MKILNSIIVPAYNEEKRSANFIPDLIDFTKKRLHGSEIIIVNDGSTDDTENIIKKMIKSKNAQDFAKLIGYGVNKGKGNAVAFGVKAAKGDKILFIDADGSIQPEDIPNMLKKLDDYDLVSGTRLSKKSKIKTNVLRKLFSFGFNSVVSLLFQYSYRDNLCGFKGFRRNSAKVLFSNLIDKRWVFDVELFYKAKKKRFSVCFLPIKWHHVGNSRVKLWKDPFLWLIRLVMLRIKLSS